MTTFYQSYLDQARHWYADSPLREFLHWWGEELKKLLPARWRNALFRDKICVLIAPGDAAGQAAPVVWQGSGGQWQRLDTEDQGWVGRLQSLLAGDRAAELEVVSLLPADKALVRCIQLPAAARDNLDNVLRYELDRYVPFNPNQVHFAWRLEKTPNGAGADDTITVKVAVIPEREFEKHLRQLAENGIQVDAVDVMTAPGQPPQAAGINLLPRHRRRHKTNVRAQLNLALLALLIVFAGLAMWNSLVSKRNQLVLLERQSKNLLSQARQAKKLQHQLRQAIVSANFIQQQKARLPSAVPILAELTERIPDDTFLQRILLNHERLEISGLSDNANKLVPVLDQSAIWYSPEVKGAVQPDPRHPGKEKFTIHMYTRPPQEDNNAASS